MKFFHCLTSLFNLLLILAGILNYVLLAIDPKNNKVNVSKTLFVDKKGRKGRKNATRQCKPRPAVGRAQTFVQTESSLQHENVDLTKTNKKYSPFPPYSMNVNMKIYQKKLTSPSLRHSCCSF